jgi:hypothetical protein
MARIREDKNRRAVVKVRRGGGGARSWERKGKKKCKGGMIGKKEEDKQGSGRLKEKSRRGKEEERE